MAPLCREFGISRVTGYKIFNRYKDCGLQGLNDRSRAPYRQANKLPYQVERTILGIRKEYPTWGARKIRDKLIKQFPMVPTPAVSTIHAVLDRHGLVKRRKRRRYKAEGMPLVATHQPNELWCTDYKGEFMLGNKQYCYPLTISDYSTRYLIGCEGVKSTKPAAFNFLQQQERFDDQIWLVSFLDYYLGYFDNERGRVEPGPNPFIPDKVLTMCPEQGVNHVTG